jgi:selenocysteine-specific elongation factor
VTDRLQTLTHGTPSELLAQTMARIEPTTQQTLFQQSGLDPDTAKAALRELESDQQIIWLERQIISRAGWQQLIDKLGAILSHYHRDHPLRLGIPREELRSRLNLASAIFNPLLSETAEQGMLVEQGSLVRSTAHEIAFSAAEQTSINRLKQQFAIAGANSPSVKDCKSVVSESVYYALVDLGDLRQLNSDVVYAADEYSVLTNQIIRFLQENQRINAAQTRDLLGTSRKYAIALLEHLDDIRVTRRVGDYRELL